VSVLVHWTTDPLLSSRFDPNVAHYQGQAELAGAMLAGFNAFTAGRREDACREWGRALRLATESANTDAVTRLTRLVDVVDAAEGIVRLKPNLSPSDVFGVAASAGESSRSGDIHRPEPVDRDAATLVTAPCGHQVPNTANFCGDCGKPVNGPSR
jgi:hypothetical protein